MIHYLQTPAPGQILQEELDGRGWSQADFAIIIGRPPRLVNEIIKSKRAITPETALELGKALGTGPELWLNLESAYRISRIRFEGGPIERRAQIYDRFPVRDLQKRGWIQPNSDLGVLERNLLKFFKISSLEESFGIPFAAKRTSYTELSAQQAAWIARGYELSVSLELGKYDPSLVPALYKSLHQCVARVEDLTRVPGILANAGIRLVIVEPLPGSKIDGACFWLSDCEPVVLLSLRYDRHDIFWHALFHELDHVEHEDGKAELVLDTDLVSLGHLDTYRRTMEERANRNAANQLIPENELDRFVLNSYGKFSERGICEFANSMRVHPGIVVGQLQHRDILPWSSYNLLKAKVRKELASSALTDGFGVAVRLPARKNSS